MKQIIQIKKKREKERIRERERENKASLAGGRRRRRRRLCPSFSLFCLSLSPPTHTILPLCHFPFSLFIPYINTPSPFVSVSLSSCSPTTTKLGFQIMSLFGLGSRYSHPLLMILFYSSLNFVSISVFDPAIFCFRFFKTVC